jgi:hypothetical protein
VDLETSLCSVLRGSLVVSHSFLRSVQVRGMSFSGVEWTLSRKPIENWHSGTITYNTFNQKDVKPRCQTYVKIEVRGVMFPCMCVARRLTCASRRHVYASEQALRLHDAIARLARSECQQSPAARGDGWAPMSGLVQAGWAST